MSLSPEAREYGMRQARKMFANRTGHGGAKIVYRQLSEADIAALFGIAFDAGKSTR